MNRITKTLRRWKEKLNQWLKVRFDNIGADMALLNKCCVAVMVPTAPIVVAYYAIACIVLKVFGDTSIVHMWLYVEDILPVANLVMAYMFVCINAHIGCLFMFFAVVSIFEAISKNKARRKKLELAADLVSVVPESVIAA